MSFLSVKILSCHHFFQFNEREWVQTMLVQRDFIQQC